MLRVKLTKLRQVCATAFMPSILKEIKPIKKSIDKYSIEYLSKATKTTDSKNESYEKRKHIIDQCFPDKTPALKDVENNENTRLYGRTTVEKTKSLISKIFGSDKSNEMATDQVLKSANVQAVAAKVEEVKLAHDINTSGCKDGVKLQQNTNIERPIGNKEEPHIQIDEANTETGTAKASALLQNINVQTTTGDIKNEGNIARVSRHVDAGANKGDHLNTTQRVSEALKNPELQDTASNVEKVEQAQNVIDRAPHVDIASAKVGDLNSTSMVAEAPETADLSAAGGKIENKTLAQHIVHIDTSSQSASDIAKIDVNPTLDVAETLQKTTEDKATTVNEEEKLTRHTINIMETPLGNNDTVKIEELNVTPKASEIPQNAKVQAATAKVEQEKLCPHTVLIDKTPFIEPDVVKSNVINATTAKIEEEKLTQKIDHIDELPHVEAGADKVEGFNTTPKIMGHDINPTLNISEPVPETFSDQPEQVNLDELAKKCLGKPDGDVDQILLNELKNISHVNSMKFNLPKDDSSQKYFSQIFENKTKDNNNIVFDISSPNLEQVLSEEIKDVTEMRFDQFQPFHLDTVPVVTTDTKDYKDECNNSQTPDNIKNLLLDIPAVLDPYDMQAIPFYQYVSRENIVLQERDQQDADSIQKPPSETIQETEINTPMNEEVILKRDDLGHLGFPESSKYEESKDLEEADDRKSDTTNSVEPLSKADHFSNLTKLPTLSESDVAKLLEYKNVLSAQKEIFGRMSPNIVSSDLMSTAEETDAQSVQPTSTMQEYQLENATQILLTSRTPTPTDPYGSPMQGGDMPKFPSSNAFPTEQERQSNQSQTDTAISAHQEPGEYFPTSHLNSFSGIHVEQIEYAVTDSCVTYTGVFDTKMTTDSTYYDSLSDSIMSQSVFYYSTFPQLSQFGEYSTDAVRSKQDCITNMVSQGELKQDKGMEAFSNNVASRSCSEDAVPLSVLLRRVRERNRMELIMSVKAETEAKNPNCLPPLDRSKPKTTLSPPKCQPKPKEQDSCKEPQPCKPPKKKDPCAKLTPFFLGILVRSGLDVSAPPVAMYDRLYTYISLAKEITFRKFRQLSQILGFYIVKQRGKTGDVVCARAFDPWVPIPSWPIPKVEKKRSLETPKHGCKLPVRPVRSNTDKPCLGMPKKISPTKALILPLLVNEI